MDYCILFMRILIILCLILLSFGLVYRSQFSKTVKVRSLSISENLEVPVEINDEDYHIFFKSGNAFYIYSDERKSIFKYDLNQQKVVDSINIGRLNIASKFDYCLSGNSLFTMKIDRNLISEYRFPELQHVDDYHFADSSNSCDYSYASIYLPFSVDRNKIVVLYHVPNLFIPDQTQREAYFSSKVIAVSRLHNSNAQLISETGNFPKEYISKLYNEFYPHAAVMCGGVVASLFSNEPIIYLSNGIEKNINGLPRNKLKEMDIDSIQFHNYTSAYNIRAEKYEWLLYDSIAKNLFIFQSHPPAPRSDGNISLWKDKLLTVYMVDSTYTVVAKKDIDRIGTYIFPSFFCFNAKLYMGRFDRNRLKFEVYEAK